MSVTARNPWYVTDPSMSTPDTGARVRGREIITASGPLRTKADAVSQARYLAQLYAHEPFRGFYGIAQSRGVTNRGGITRANGCRKKKNAPLANPLTRAEAARLLKKARLSARLATSEFHRWQKPKATESQRSSAEARHWESLGRSQAFLEAVTSVESPQKGRHYWPVFTRGREGKGRGVYRVQRMAKKNAPLTAAQRRALKGILKAHKRKRNAPKRKKVIFDMPSKAWETAFRKALAKKVTAASAAADQEKRDLAYIRRLKHRKRNRRGRKNPLLQIVTPAIQGLAMGAGAAIGSRAVRTWNVPKTRERNPEAGMSDADLRAYLGTLTRKDLQKLTRAWGFPLGATPTPRLIDALIALRARRTRSDARLGRNPLCLRLGRDKRGRFKKGRRRRNYAGRLALPAMARLRSSRAQLTHWMTLAPKTRRKVVGRKRGRLTAKQIAVLVRKARFGNPIPRSTSYCVVETDALGRTTRLASTFSSKREAAKKLKALKKAFPGLRYSLGYGQKNPSAQRDRLGRFVKGKRRNPKFDLGSIRLPSFTSCPPAKRRKRNPLTRRETAMLLRMARGSERRARRLKKGSFAQGLQTGAAAARYHTALWAGVHGTRKYGASVARLTKRLQRLPWSPNPKANPLTASARRMRPGQKILSTKIIPWAQARKAPGFAENLRAFKRFHKAAPRHATIVRIADGSKKTTRRVVFAMGEAPEAVYRTFRGMASNKAGKNGRKITWVHKMGEQGGKPPLLVHDAKSGVSSFVGGTYRVTDWMRR